MLVIGALATPVTAAELGDRVGDLPADASRRLLDLLRLAGMLAEMTPSGVSSEQTHEGLMGWEFHDLLFHSRSREGRHDGVLGNAYPLAGRREPPAVVKPVAAGGPAIELYRPDLSSLESHDPPLAWVMEQRRSIREYGSDPMTARQLGEFLYRVARVREIQPMMVDTPCGKFQMELSSRPYPTGGGLFALEVYPVVRACRDLAPGLYHYDPVQHGLGPIAGMTPAVEQLLDEAGYAMGTHGEHVQVLLVLTARFERVTWKYSGLAYSLILKDVGVVFQNMYLAATAMDLAPCAVGAGNSDLFARAIGSDYYSETSVGEFTLGSTR
jgi:SagB-type dehydrogenase family enzyme